MIDEILCALFVRVRILGGVALACTITLCGCGSPEIKPTEADLNSAVRRVQRHEAAIETCPCAAAVCEHAAQICVEAETMADADLRARCHQANHRCESITEPNAATDRPDQECACE